MRKLSNFYPGARRGLSSVLTIYHEFLKLLAKKDRLHSRNSFKAKS